MLTEEGRKRQDEERAKELAAAPLKKADKSTWPPGVRPIAWGEMDAIGVDAKGDLYWHGKAVNVRHRVDLDRTQTVIAIVVAASIGLAK
jgi:hypothetical protein